MINDKLHNDRFMRALACQSVDRTPVWMMRQAGRYLPEYRAVRKIVPDFMSLCKNPELACEVTLQPLARYELDAAILFSDILTIPDAMGLGLEFIADIGPRLSKPLRDRTSIENLAVPDPELSIAYVSKTISLTKHELSGQIPLLGFSGSPWTLACYMVEGGGSKEFSHPKKLLYSEPLLCHQLLSKITDAIIAYCQMQINAGVNALMLFDTWGGILTTPAYHEFSLSYMRKIIAALPPSTPIIVFTKGGGQWLQSIAESGCRGIGLDWTINLDQAINAVPKEIALQGNLDPTILLADQPAVVKETTRLLEAVAGRPGHIFNLGHGILPATPPENVTVMIETIKNFKAEKASIE